MLVVLFPTPPLPTRYVEFHVTGSGEGQRETGTTATAPLAYLVALVRLHHLA